jgi:hypothetical protein
MPWTPPPQPALATDRFILILNALWEWVGTKAGPAMTSALHLAIRAKLSRTRARFAILAKRFHAGTLTPPQPRTAPRKPRPPPPSPPPPGDAQPGTRPVSILPRHRAWLCELIPSWAAGGGSQMEHLLNTPDLEAMAAASPEVGRLIRPLLWMTGRTPPAYLALPPRPGRAVGRVRASRRRPPRPGSAAPAPPPAPPPHPDAVPPCLPRIWNIPRRPAPPPQTEPEIWYPYRVGREGPS